MRLPKFEAKSRIETSRTDVRRVSNADFNEEIRQTLVAWAGSSFGLTGFLLKRVSPIYDSIGSSVNATIERTVITIAAVQTIFAIFFRLSIGV